MKGVSDIPKYFLSGLCIADTIALYTILGVKHLLSSGQLDLEKLYQLYANQIKNTLEYLKLLSKVAIIILRETLDTKNMLIAQNCRNISGN